MPFEDMSLFDDAMNSANTAFKTVCGESFELAKTGNLGTYQAVSIDDLEGSSIVNPGGAKGEFSTILFVQESVITASAMVEGSILVVRGKRVRVKSIVDEGDDTFVVNCGSVGATIR